MRKHGFLYSMDKGAALPAVIMVMLVVMTLSGVVVSLVTAQTKEENYYENNMTALHAAEAGLNQYLWSLNKEKSTPIDFDTVINYPEDNPVAAFKLAGITDNASIKVVQSTGWMLGDPSVTRTVTATFTKRSFTQYIYFSDNDPYLNKGWNNDEAIWWTGSENCYGPYHTNTMLCVRDRPNFWGKATSTLGIRYAKDQATDYPYFHKGYEKLGYTIDMPSNNSELMRYGNASEGYYFEGRTSIRLNEDGTITVWNPNYTPATQTLPLPENGVIYVNEKAGHSNGDTFNKYNGNVFISGVLKGRLTVAAANDIFITGYDPTKEDLTAARAAVTDGITYKNSKIILHTEGTNKGTTTYEGPEGEEGDMLGLIANRNVAVLTIGWFPKDRESNVGVDVSRRQFYIYAAVMAVNGSFMNSNPSYPSGGGSTLTVRGSIIQNTRGAVGYFNSDTGVSSSGYQKSYAHDPRMAYETPPHFLAPEGSGWEITEWNEVN